MHVGSCSIREMQIETAVRYNYTLIRMAKIKTTDHTKCWQVCKKLKLSDNVGGSTKMVQSP